MDFSALKTQIQQNIKTNNNEDITGSVLQSILLGIVSTLGDDAINDLISALGQEVTNRQKAVQDEADARVAAINNVLDLLRGEVQARQDADAAEHQRAEAAFDDLDMIDAAGVDVRQESIDLTLRKNDGSDEDPEWRTLCSILLPSVSYDRAGLMSVDLMNKLLYLMNGGYLFQGVAVPASDPGTPHASCFYLATKSGTYTNFRNADDDPIVIEHDAIYVLTYDTVENNYWEWNKVTDFGDGVFDISMYNLTEGQPTAYADLSAALGTNGANVPAAFRKGGMSIKFVHTSDNNYVQFRYMLTDVTTAATFTNVANWQGISDKPIDGSEDIVNSGGVKHALNKVDISEVDITSNLVFESSKKIDSTGAIVSSSDDYYLSKPVKVEGLYKIKVLTGGVLSNCYGIGVYTKNGEFIENSSYLPNQSYGFTKEIEIPQNAYYIIIAASTYYIENNQVKAYLYSYNYAKIYELDKKIDSSTIIEEELVLSDFSSVSLHIANNSPNVWSSGNRTILVPVTEGEEYHIVCNYQYGTNYALLTSIDNVSSGSTVDYVQGTSRVSILNNETKEVIIPSTAKYIALRKDSDSNPISIIRYTSVSTMSLNAMKLANENNESIDNINQSFAGLYSIESIAFSRILRYNYYISSSLEWVESSKHYSRILKVNKGDKIIVRSTNYSLLYNFVTDVNFDDTNVPIANGDTARREIPADTDTILVAGTDANYLVLRSDIYNNQVVTVTWYHNNITDYKHSSNRVVIAASNSTPNDKALADFVCNGQNDELVIQGAIDYIVGAANTKKPVVVTLLSGDYYIDSFPSTNAEGRHVAIQLPSFSNQDTIGSGTFKLLIEGDIYNSENSIIHVTDSCYNSLSSEDNYSVISARAQAGYNHYALHDLAIYIPDAKKKIICVDGKLCGALNLERLRIVNSNHFTWTSSLTEEDLPIEDCIGVRAACWDGNSFNNQWDSIYSIGFGQGFAIGGEHLFARKLVAIYGRYGFTFNDYNNAYVRYTRNSSSHPNTLIACSDEANANLWKFGKFNYRIPVYNIYDLSLEIHANWMDLNGRYSREETPGQFRGHINFAQWEGRVNTKFWEEGSGVGFETINDNHKKVCSSSERNNYIPFIGQEVFDTTLNKKVTCVNPSCRKWVDSNGNLVSKDADVTFSGTLKDVNDSNLSGTLVLTSFTDGSVYEIEVTEGVFSATIQKDRYNITFNGYYIINGDQLVNKNSSVDLVGSVLYTITGTVTNQSGEQSTNYYSLAFCDVNDESATFFCDYPNGAYSIQIPAGTYKIGSRNTVLSPTENVTITGSSTINVQVKS